MARDTRLKTEWSIVLLTEGNISLLSLLLNKDRFQLSHVQTDRLYPGASLQTNSNRTTNGTEI